VEKILEGVFLRGPFRKALVELNETGRRNGKAHLDPLVLADELDGRNGTVDDRNDALGKTWRREGQG
jgi:hypothetical protein